MEWQMVVDYGLLRLVSGSSLRYFSVRYVGYPEC